MLDVFQQIQGKQTTLVHNRSVIHGGKFRRLNHLPDMKQAQITTQPASPSVLDEPGSAERFLFLSFFRWMFEQNDRTYEFVGWQEQAGRRCLVVDIGVYPKGVDDTAVYRMWIDTGRGFHPLRCDFLVNQKLRMRTDAIELEEFAGQDRRRVWLPVKATTSSFMEGVYKFSEKPLYVETYDVVRSSLVINAKVSDKDFDILRDVDVAHNEDLAAARRQFNEAVEERRFRTDPASVQAKLDRSLAEADRQAAELTASSTARRNYFENYWPQLVLTAVAACLLASALAIMKRQRA